MPIYVFDPAAGINRVPETTFSELGLHERRDLQRLLRENIEVISPETLIISEEFGDWDESHRRIDLLGIDKSANLVVIELKRTENGGHMELQAIRYAAMVSTMTFDQAVDVFGRYLDRLAKTETDAKEALLDFLGWEVPDEDSFAQDVRIVLASAEFSKELTSSVLWLLEHQIAIRCVRMKPYTLNKQILVDVEQIIPLPELEEFQVRVGVKAQKKREARVGGIDFTRFDIYIDGEFHAAMTKRDAILLICKRLCSTGTDPETIAQLLNWRRNRVWRSVDGEVNAADFAATAAAQASLGGNVFDPRRWFYADDDIVHANNRTYAFSNQWGGEGWLKAMELLREAFPDLKIAFSPAN